jgi:hypothetical protein
VINPPQGDKCSPNTQELFSPVQGGRKDKEEPSGKVFWKK